MSVRFDEEMFLNMEPDVLRAIIREAVHHGVETRLYLSFDGKIPAFEVPAKVKKLLDLCESRGLDPEKPDIKWARKIVSMAEAWYRGDKPEYDGHRPVRVDSELESARRLLFGRRSIRQWKSDPVPREMLVEIVKAATYAPTACLVQGARYVILDDPADLAAVKSREFTGETAKIIALMDKRPYEILAHIPKKNLLLDIGAAMQNMLLMAEALGLGACWGTLNDAEIQRIRQHLGLPEYYDVIAFISLGYPDEEVLTPGRASVEDVILGR